MQASGIVLGADEHLAETLFEVPGPPALMHQIGEFVGGPVDLSNIEKDMLEAEPDRAAAMAARVRQWLAEPRHSWKDHIPKPRHRHGVLGRGRSGLGDHSTIELFGSSQ